MSAHWDDEISALEAKTAKLLADGTIKSGAIVGVGVDNATKRDYFKTRLLKILDRRAWRITYRILTVEDNMRATDVIAAVMP